MKFYKHLCWILFTLSACNSAYVKPDSLRPHSTIYADRGGFTMRRAIKEHLEERGYTVVVGTATKSATQDDDNGDIEISIYQVPSDADYAIEIRERKERFAPVWCAFNGFWWWRFNVSISDQRSGEEILSWFGYGCANSSVRMLDRILDDMEISKE